MFEIGEYVVYKKDVCKIIDIKENIFNHTSCYLIVPIDDESLKINVPVGNKNEYLRKLISKEEIEQIINDIPNIHVIENNDRMIETEYKHLLSSNLHRDLIKIIKTTFARNQERLDNNKKTRDKDSQYFEQAERYIYNEFSLVLGLSYEDTKKYVNEKVLELMNEDNS